MAIADLVAAGKEFGIFTFYLPFIITFGIIWGLLTKSKVFGAPDEKHAKVINLVISLAASLFVMAYTPIGVTIGTFLSNLFAGTLIVIVTLLAILMIVFIVSGVTGMPMKPGRKMGIVIILLLIAIGIGVFISSGGTAFFPGLTWGIVPAVPIELIAWLTTQDAAILILVILTGLVLWWTVKESKEERVIRLRKMAKEAGLRLEEEK